ncbi:hypothetical protein OOZ15_07935 [Galbibacter sp. EGI 63066]|uniref:hypothetical protein n=1 Tax=Galbibacter sp. EGI 63066 TaxID=2993559 RepID=UPI002249538A|nr:hypothetical protein [Galbibacter sp. EGI 63066]MCX2679861.1 hypothetical protein [Galbibacter sp. EGI 63066]
MKKILFIFILISITSCAEKKSTKSEQIIKYYEGFKNSDYNQIKRTISDSLTIIEGDYTMAYTPESFYNQFKWDSVFKPVYKLVSLENENKQVVATVSVNSLRFEFLKNNPLTCKHKFHFKSGKINKIETLDCIDANWEIWQKERDTLVNWVKFNHPELDGFINDLNMKGAIDYLNAIELYKKSQVKVIE